MASEFAVTNLLTRAALVTQNEVRAQKLAVETKVICELILSETIFACGPSIALLNSQQQTLLLSTFLMKEIVRKGTY